MDAILQTEERAWSVLNIGEFHEQWNNSFVYMAVKIVVDDIIVQHKVTLFY
jgi:hypothetical protein